LRVTSRRKPASSRGISIPEILIGAAIGMSAIGLVIGLCKPILTAQTTEQASTGEIQVIDATLYRLQRDVRQSDTNGIFVCANANDAITCTQASTYSSPTDAPALAVLTAESGGSGPTRWDSTGHPLWTGFKIYWLAAGTGGADSMYAAFEPASVSLNAQPSVLNSDAAQAVSAALAATAPDRVADGILSLQSYADVTKDHVALRLTALANPGTSSGQLSVQGDAYARN